MGELTSIGWTDHTFNPWWGCIRVSPGCEHCYAETFAKRVGQNVWGPAKTTERRLFGEAHWREPVRWNAAAEKAGVRARVFCASMADVFEGHPALPPERAKLWRLIDATPWLDWQLLTKRPHNVRWMVPPTWEIDGWPTNVWLGASVEDQQRANERLPALGDVPAAVLFLSCEPLLGPVDLGPWAPMLDWIIIGGESGPGARPMDIAWARALVKQAQDSKVAVFVKQLGARSTLNYYDWRDLVGCEHDGRRVYVTREGSTYEHREPDARSARDGQPPLDAWVYFRTPDAKGEDWNYWPEDLWVREWPESAAGVRT